MRLTHLTRASYRDMPWKNGLGTTTEIARHPEGGEFDWRASIASVSSDGAFSSYPGCDRVILLLEGSGLVLEHRASGTEVLLGHLEPWGFSGDWETTGTLTNGAVRDLNVITRREAFTASVKVVQLDSLSRMKLPAHTTLIYCVEGSMQCNTRGQRELAPGDTLLVERGTRPARIMLLPLAERAVIVVAELAAEGS